LNLDQIFKDLRVIELASVLAGPTVGTFFAELGAEVIKIENKKTGGDVTRQWKLANEAKDLAGSSYYYSVNWGKESVFLDLSIASDQEIVYQYIKEADIVITNYKAGAAEKLGMDYPSLSKLNPSIIYGAISAYGRHDPRPGYDALIQAETGWISMNGEKDAPGVKMPVALMDILSAHQLKEGILIALINRAKTGNGSRVDVSLFDSGIAALANQAGNYLNEGKIPIPKGNEHPNIAPYGDSFTMADGKRVLLAIGNDRQFNELLSLLELDHVLEDARYHSNIERVQNRSSLISLLAEALAVRKTASFLARCHELKIPAAQIQNLEEIFSQAEMSEYILESRNETGDIKKGVKTIGFKIQ